MSFSRWNSFTYFKLMLHFYTPWKCQKTSGLKWVKFDWILHLITSYLPEQDRKKVIAAFLDCFQPMLNFWVLTL